MIIDKEKLFQIKEKALNDNIPILQDESLELIETILSIKKPNKILEVGTAVGYSAICFSKYLDKNGSILTIEINEDRYKEALNNIDKLNLSSSIKVVNDDAVKYLEDLNEKFDVIFIDAAKGQYINFLNQAKRLIEKNGIIIADNVFFKGRVLNGYNEHKHRTAVNRLREYIDNIKEDKDFKSTVLNVGDGVAISVKI
jgi:predicted O-methyltransferase YrrM